MECVTINSSGTNTYNPIYDVKEAYIRLEKAVMNINSNQEWLRYLAFSSRFYNYSFQNTLLIYLQNENSSYVAGIKKWNELGRYVKKGEKAIKVFAPCKYKVEQDKAGSDEAYIIKGFKLVSVFDISQTQGDDSRLPVLITGLRNHLINESRILEKLLKIIDIPIVETENINAKGSYNIINPQITIKSNLSVVQKIKTLCHEFSHHLHHTKYFDNESYDVSEMIVEAAAYVICSYLNIDTSDYSVSYIKSWCKDIKDFKNVAVKVQKISSDVINLLEKSPEETDSTVSQGIY